MADEAQVERIVARQEQRRVDRHVERLRRAVRRPKRQGVDHFSVQQDDNLAEVAQQRGREVEGQGQRGDRKSTRLNPVTNAQIVGRLLLETKKYQTESKFKMAIEQNDND